MSDDQQVRVIGLDGEPAARATDQGLVSVVKAHFIDEELLAGSNVVQPEEQDRVFTSAGAIQPPYDPEMLCLLYEHSNSLRQNIDAYATNIDGFGHRFDPVFNLKSDDIDDRLATAMFIDRERASKDPEVDDPTKQVAMPTAEEVAATKREIVEQMRYEKAILDNFFDFACPDISFVSLRRRTREELEATGNAYWEIIRNAGGEVAQFNYVAGFTIRLLPLEKKPFEVDVKVKVSDLSYAKHRQLRRFRLFVQVVDFQAVIFKEYGDPRIYSKKTGQPFESLAALKANDETDEAATELLHFKIHNPRTPYGIPRWIGNLLAVLGSRQAEEVNFLYFENKSVPPLAVLVSGGKLAGETVPRLQDYIKNHLKGKANFHKILVLEAEASGGADNGRVKIDLKPLTAAQHNDALFQNYDERNMDKVGQAFRLPRMLRGDIRDFNRSCYSADTETLTENGWKLYGAIGPDERIAAFNLNTHAIEFVVPAKKLVYSVVDEEMWRFRNKNVDCLVTGDHRMLARSAQTRAEDPPWLVHEASKIPFDRFEFVQAAEVWEGESELRSFSLPKVEACRIERGHDHESTVSGDDWLEFLGYWIAEGGLLTTNHPAAPYLVYLDQKKPKVREKIRACLDRLGWKYSTQLKPCGTTHFLFSNRCLRDWLLTNCGDCSQSLRLPSAYLRLPRRQLEILLRAMMDGDGTVDRREGHASGGYYSTSPTLVGQAQQLFIQLGKRSSVRWSPGANCFRATYADRTTTRLSATGSKWSPASVTRERYTGEVYCFSVPTHGFFVTRRNGKVAIQGNTGDAALSFAEMQVFQPERAEFDFLINRRVLAEMGIRFWRFTSNAPVTRDPTAMAEIIRNLVNANVLTPEEGRELASDVFNREFHRLGAAWTKQPVQVTLAGIPVDDGKTDGAPRAPAAPATKAAILKSVAPEVRRLVRLRDSLASIADAEHEEELLAQRRAENE